VLCSAAGPGIIRAMAKPDIADLETRAESIRAELRVPQQNDVFKAAVEVGYLAALADGEVDDEELATIVRAVEILSQGAVIEWEAEDLVAECARKAEAETPAKRAAAVGAELKALGHGDAAVYFAALVAHASKGIDKKEAEVLKDVGKAAGLTADRVKEIVKKASGK
jgi:tellurite resistance protein